MSETSGRILQSCREGCGSKKKKKKNGSRLWDLDIPSELLQEILSRLVLKVNIHASLVCKTWCEAAVSVRKSKPRPWLFYPQDGTDSTYILADPSGSQTHKELSFPELKEHRFCYSTDGWLLVMAKSSLFFLNPFTREKIHLPEPPASLSPYCSAFSADPTSSNCLVISLIQSSLFDTMVIITWRPGETSWTTYFFENELQYMNGPNIWAKCVFSNGMLYCLSSCGCLGVFDPSTETWNILPVNPCRRFSYLDLKSPVLMMEHEGDIFVMYTPDDNKKKNLLMLKLNLTREVWEKKRDLGGLTVFASYSGSVARACLSSEEKNRIYPLNFTKGKPQDMYYYSLTDEKSSNPPSQSSYSPRVAWVDPPLDNNL